MTEHHIISQRVQALRDWMEENGYAAYIVPTADPHLSEYLPEHWKCREWLTGFTGSAGTAVVTMHSAAQWADSRYWLQAETELENTPFTLMKDGAEGCPGIAEWLKSQLPEGGDVAFYGPTLPRTDALIYSNLLPDTFRLAQDDEDPFETLWEDRPPMPSAPVTVQPLEYAGLDVPEKMERIWHAVQSEGNYVEHILLSDLSEIAWTLNLRGADIAYNPVFTAYLLLHTDCTATLFTDLRKVEGVKDYLTERSIAVRPYEDILEVLKNLTDTEAPVGVGLSANCGIYSIFANPAEDKFINVSSPVPHLQKLKVQEEQEGFRRAMERDGVAMVRFLRRLDEGTAGHTEMEVAQTLEALRAEGRNYCGLSFGTISAYGPPGAIVHYEPTPATDARLEPRGFLLLDSGAQYLDGTTDITRTIPLGPLTEEEKTVYTLVLKGHIGLASLHFPNRTTGLALDLAARRALWQAGYDFGHGTGHGVGSHLCVHEGVAQIRKDLRPGTLERFVPDMVITDEPGVYLAGKFGVRIENVLLCTRAEETPHGRFCRFETLTLCPIDTRPVLTAMLTHEETGWLNAYHAEVRRRLLPLLTDEADKRWLNAATESI
ncbi:MAG: aminopeptidase P family protein [Alloprevotella sp.]|nr:aminopeptidase P family protein [Alloprevotella sp.]